MRKFALLVGICLVGGCGNTFETPLSADQPEVISKIGPSVFNYWGHGMTATLPSGRISFICETQPREYIDGFGQSHWEVDHYVDTEPCPLRPID